MATPQEGYLKIYRRLFSSARWYNGTTFDERSAWIDILGRACFMPSTVNIKGVELSLNVGDFIASQRTLARDWNWSRGKVRNFLSNEIKHGKIRFKFNSTRQAQLQANGISVLNVCNFERYNFTANNVSPRPSPRQAHPSNINKEYREEKEELPLSTLPRNFDSLTPEFYDDDDDWQEVEEVAMRGASHSKNVEEVDSSSRSNGVETQSAFLQKKEFESVATGYNRPSLNEWRREAFAIGWRQIREIDSSWGNYSASGWKQKNGLPILDWRSQLVVSRNWWDTKNGRISDDSLAVYLDAETPIRGWVRAYLELTNKSIEEAKGTTWRDVVADKKLAMQLLRNLWNDTDTRKNFL